VKYHCEFLKESDIYPAVTNLSIRYGHRGTRRHLRVRSFSLLELNVVGSALPKDSAMITFHTGDRRSEKERRENRETKGRANSKQDYLIVLKILQLPHDQLSRAFFTTRTKSQRNAATAANNPVEKELQGR
jgi:hypothetical protein